MSEFTCRICQTRYISDPQVTESMRVAEYEIEHGRAFPGRDDVGSVCDDCYPKVMQWARNVGLVP